VVRCGVDVVQIAATLFIIFVLSGELVQAIVLAIVYLIFLFVDVYCLVVWMSPQPSLSRTIVAA
jgi:hypothetical protein